MGMRLVPLRIAFWCDAWRKKRPRVAASSFLIRLRTSHKRARSLPLAEARLMSGRFPLDVKEGDRVLFGKYAGSEIKINGEELLILREDEVLAVLTGTQKAKEQKAETRK